MDLKKSLFSPSRSRLFWFLPVIALTALPALAETVLIESRTTSGATGGITPNPPYEEAAGSWSGSSSHTSAQDTTAGIGSRYAFGGTPVLTLHPTLIAGATYALEVAHIVINASPNLVVNITYGGCTGTSNSTTAFNNTISPSGWVRVGLVTVDSGVTTPTVTFTYASGTLASTGGRWYSDAYRFINLSEPCVTALPQLTTVNGPLAAGQTNVDVPGVDASATAVTVYADDVQIGQKTSGIAAGVNHVTVSPLVKGRIITVTQSNGAAVESCRPSGGPRVGGGANPRLRMALSIRQNTDLTGPIGSSGGTSNTIIKFLGATNVVAGLGTAPKGAKVFQPSNDWHAVTFLRGPNPATPTDPGFLWNGTDATNPNQLKGNFGVLDSLALAIDDLSDTGPFEIYIDNLMNGDVLVQDFEAAAAGANTVLFNQPSLSGTTSPFLLSAAPGSISPDISKVSNATADTGTNSLRVSWQFKDTAAQNWLRLVAQGSGTPNPQLDLRLPISFRLLLLPVGQSVTSLPPTIVSQPQNQSVFQGSSVTLGVSAHGTQPFTYQWRFNGSVIPGANDSSLTLTDVQPSAAGNYRVDVGNSFGNIPSSNAIVTVVNTTFSSAMTPLWHLAAGSTPFLTNDNSQRGIAYNGLSGNLLLASTAGGSNTVYVLNGDTGELIGTLLGGPVITDGDVVFNQVGVDIDGSVYVGNLTTNGSTQNFNLYGWFDDRGLDAPYLAWSGDPGAGMVDRWGDTLAIRGSTDARQAVLGARSHAAISIIDFGFSPDVAPQVITIAGADAGDFGLGLDFGSGNTIWAKGLNGLLRHASFDLNSQSGAVLQSFSGYPNLAPLAIDAAHKLCAGVSIEAPDNLRLIDIANLGGGVFDLDTEFFPTDNPNPNKSGAVAFGPDRVYALDANNGLIAMSLNLACVPTRLSATVSGSDLIFSWGRADYHLQGSATLGSSASWGNIPGATSATVSASSGKRFFRLVCP